MASSADGLTGAPGEGAPKGSGGGGRPLEGRRVVVTGASGGIGAATVRRLVLDGARVVAVARRPEPLEALSAETGAIAHPADAARADDVERLATAVLGEGAPFAVVHAVGGFELAPIAETTPEMFDRMVSGNLRAPFLVTRAFLPAMLEAGAGHVVTVGSVAGRVAFPENGAYSASKFGVRGLHEVLLQELGGTGVQATLIEPAATDTGIWDPLDPDARDDLPGREAMLPPEAVADAIHYVITRPSGVQLPTIAVQRS